MDSKWKLFLITLVAVILIGGVGMFLIWGGKKKDTDEGTENVVVLELAGTDAAQTTGNSSETQADITAQGSGDTDAVTDTEETENGEDAVTVELPETAVTLGEGISETHEYLVNTAVPEEMTITFAGDILFDPGYAMYSAYRSRGSQLYSVMSESLVERMRRADVMMLNNEFSISDRGAPVEGKSFTFRAEPSSIALYGEMGVDIVSLANNHAFDYGPDAFLDTMEHLAAANIPFAGAGHNIEEASKPLYLYGGGMKIAIVAATQLERINNPHSLGATATSAGMLRCWPDINPTLEAIRKASEESDFCILFVHWGSENVTEPDWGQNEQLPKFIDAGADLIIGAHSHILQPIDYVSGVPVVYSLGNFWFNSKSLDTGMIEATFEYGGLSELRFVPCRQADCSVKLLEDTEADRVLEYMQSISPHVSIDAEGVISW